MFASLRYGLVPDLLTLAKSIGGGVPMGAVLIHERLGVFPRGVHGATSGGNPLACAASLAAINFLEANALPARAAELGAWFVAQLQRIDSPLIREVRGMGLMVGIELNHRVSPYSQALMTKGVLVGASGAHVMRFLPPLVISQDDLSIVVEAVADVLHS